MTPEIGVWYVFGEHEPPYESLVWLAQPGKTMGHPVNFTDYLDEHPHFEWTHWMLCDIRPPVPPPKRFNWKPWKR